MSGSKYSITRLKDGQATKLENALPAYFLAEEGEPESNVWGAPMAYPYRAVLAPTTDGFVMVGPPAADGSSDTYVLRDGSDAFELYALRSSDDHVYAQAACTYRGRLFVIGSAWFEPEQRIFRATALGVPEYPGDIPCEVDPDPKADPAPGPNTGGGSGASPTGKRASSAGKALPKTGDIARGYAVALTSLAGSFLLCLGLAKRKRKAS